MSWHADRALLARYARGELDEAAAFSVEAHLVACAACRAGVAPFVDAKRLERVWEEVADGLDIPRPGVVERALLRMGVPDYVARLLAATPSLSLSWFAAVALSLAFAVGAAYATERAFVFFLALAPLLPLGGVAAAYGPGIDPTHEIGAAAPLRSSRLLLLRAATVLTTTIALVALGALALPELDWRAAAWLLPSLALVAASLALATFLEPLWASGSIAFAWIAAVVVTSTAADDRYAVFRGGGQLVFAVVFGLAAILLVRRREMFDEEGRA